jgi:hypothetical protein
MPISSTWLVPYTVFLSTFYERVTLHDFEQMNIENMAEAVKHGADSGVFVCLHLMPNIEYSRDFLNVKALKLVTAIPPKTSAIIIIDSRPNLAARFIGLLVFQMMGLQNYTTRTLPEAARLIEKLQPNIVFPASQP